MSKCETFNFNVDLNNGNHLTNQMKLNLFETFFKFLLIHRCQLPLPFDKIKEELNQREYQQRHEQQQQQRQVLKKHLNIKNFNIVSDFISKFEQITFNLRDIHNKGIKMNKILFIIGGSIVTPKESFYLYLNSNNQKTRQLRHNSKLDNNFIKKFFSSLICFFQTISFKEIGIAPIYFLFEAERSDNIKWFLPKLNYTPLFKGKQIHLRINEQECCECNDYEDECNFDDKEELKNLSFDSKFNFDISGIEPLNQTFERVLDLNNMFNEHLSLSTTQQQQQQNDLIWYQAPFVLKGLKHF